MVTIVGFQQCESKEGKPFVAIELQGEPKLLQSPTTGNFYLTANKTKVSTSLSVDACKMIVGQKLPGRVDKVEVEPYEYVNKQTGEVFALNYAYVYIPEEDSVHQISNEYQSMEYQPAPMIFGNTDITKVIASA